MINLQSSGPLGLGELANLPDGNSILTLKNKNGEDVDYKLWIDDFTSDLNMEIDITQLRSGYSYRPIRVQERTLTFTTIWSLANRPKYEELVEAIREHWAYNFNELLPTPAHFTYFGANKTFSGFILNAERRYAVPDTLLSFSFDMKLINSRLNQYVSEVSIYSYYIPRPDNIKVNGIDGWYAISDLIDKPEEPEEEEPKDPVVGINWVQRREGGVYIPREFSTYSETKVKTEGREDIKPTRQEYRAALIWYFVNLHVVTSTQDVLTSSIMLADKYMNGYDEGNPDSIDQIENYWFQVNQEDWEQYLYV